MTDLASEIQALASQGLGWRQIVARLGCTQYQVYKHTPRPGRIRTPFPVHPEVEAAKMELLAAWFAGGQVGTAREKLRVALETHHPHHLRHPDQVEPAAMQQDAFQRRARPATSRFLGPININAWAGPHFENYCNLLSDGWNVSVFLNDKEQRDWWSADPDAGTVTFSSGTLKGIVEIRMERP